MQLRQCKQCSLYCGYIRRIITFVWPWYRPWWPRFVSRRQFSTPPLKMLLRTRPSFPIKIVLAKTMSCPWSHHSTCEHVGNRCTVLPKKWFHDVVFVCCSLKGGRWARQISDRKFTGRASISTFSFAPYEQQWEWWRWNQRYECRGMAPVDHCMRDGTVVWWFDRCKNTYRRILVI